MAVSGADTARENRVLTTTLDRYSPQISNELKRNDGVVAAFGVNNAIKMADGGERAVETLDIAENPNFAFRSHLANIATELADTRAQAKYAWATCDGAVVKNAVEVAMNSGRAKVYDLVASDIENAANTMIRKISDALRKSSPASTEPESVYSVIQNAAAASQTGSTGEIARNTTYWFNQYSNTAMDLSTAGGEEALAAFMFQSIGKGASKKDRPNVILGSGTLFAALLSLGDTLRRLPADAKLAELGFETIRINEATFIMDPAITAGDLYIINTNHMFLQVLRTPGMKDMGERPQSFPISTRGFQEGYNTLNAASIMYVTFALTCSSLQRQGIATNCS